METSRSACLILHWWQISVQEPGLRRRMCPWDLILMRLSFSLYKDDVGFALPSIPTEIPLEPGVTWQMLCRSTFNALKLEHVILKLRLHNLIWATIFLKLWGAVYISHLWENVVGRLPSAAKWAVSLLIWELCEQGLWIKISSSGSHRK